MAGRFFSACPGAFIFALVLAGPSHGQTPDEMLTRYRRANHGESAVYVQKNTTITIERGAQGLVATRKVEEERITLKTLSGEAANEQVGYSGLVPLKSISAYTLTPEKNKYKKEEVKRFVHKDERERNIFHDDSRSVSFLFPAVLPGAITHLDYELTYSEARFLSAFFFAAEVPVEESKLTVVHGKDVAVDVRQFHIPEGALITSSEEKRGHIIDTYAMREVPTMEVAPDGPDLRYYSPHVQLVVRDLAGPAAETALTDIQRLYQWYYGRVVPVSGTTDPALAKIAAQVTEGATDDNEKAKRLYAWVQDNIKYVAVEDGMNGFIPAPATKVCSDRYGDCKAMANLLRALLVNAGLDAHLAWTGSRELPYSYDELPTTATDDHMIVVLRNDTGHIFLDATSDQCPYGMPSFYIQGKQVLMAIDSSRYELLRAPVIPATANTLVDSVHVQVDGTDLVGTGIMRLRGQERAGMASLLNWVPKDKWADQLRRQHMKLNNRYQPENVIATGREDRNEELILRYSFRIPGVVTTSGSERFLPLDLEFPWRDKNYAKDRKVPVEGDYASVETYVTVLDPAPGTIASHVPPATAKDDPLFGYTCDYVTGPDGRVTCTSVYRTGYIFLPTERVQDWTSIVNAREQELNRSVVLSITP